MDYTKNMERLKNGNISKEEFDDLLKHMYEIQRVLDSGCEAYKTLFDCASDLKPLLNCEQGLRHRVLVGFIRTLIDGCRFLLFAIYENNEDAELMKNMASISKKEYARLAHNTQNLTYQTHQIQTFMHTLKNFEKQELKHVN